MKVRDERRADPDLLVELAVDDGRLGGALDADGFLLARRRAAAAPRRARRRPPSASAANAVGALPRSR